jgi:hypothetical protein
MNRNNYNPNIWGKHGFSHGIAGDSHRYIFKNNYNFTGTEVLTLSYDGKVGIGKANPAVALDVAGQIKLLSSNIQWDIGKSNDTALYIQASGYTNFVYLTPSGTGWAAGSDIRIKKNINSLENIIEKIKLLNPVSYNMKSQTEDNTKIYYGFIAQEVINIFPHLVSSTNNDEMDDGKIYGIEYTTFIPFLTRAIQEQQNIIETLQSENLLLKDQIQAILERLTALENK